MRKETIRLARASVNFWNKVDFKEIMLKTLIGKKAYISRTYFYHFNDSSLVGDVIYGEIYKARLRGHHNELISPENFEYRQIQMNELHETSKYCIFPDHTIAISSRSKFKSDEFIDIFKKLFNLNCPEFAQIEINYRKDDYDIFNIINSFDKMIEVDIKKLRKSNPDPKPSFDPIETFLKEERTDEYSADFVANQESPKGLNRDYSSHIMSAISLTDAGYGQSWITGIKNGAKIIIRSIDKIIEGTIDRIEEPDPSRFINAIVEKLYVFSSRLNF